MPIRINLLAEQQAADEVRRKDPVKRVIWGAVIVVALFIAWIGILQVQTASGRSEVEAYESRLKRIEETSKQVRSDRGLATDIERRIASVDAYSSNRFLWANALDAFQAVTTENIRIVEFNATQRYMTNESSKFFSTNLTVSYSSSQPGWKFWASSGPDAELMTTVTNQLKALTSRPPFTTNKIKLLLKLSMLSTNTSAKMATARAEYIMVPAAIESTVIEIKGRDYSNPPGSLIDSFTRNLTNLPYFRERLHQAEGQALRFTDRPAQARPDSGDTANPTALFVPFTIECRLQERILTND